MDEVLNGVQEGIGIVDENEKIIFCNPACADEEWEIMRQHPLYAYEMLASIPYIRPALDIPYCHHEKWDGTGYLRALKGEQIPKAARIFGGVDMWDALSSDLPYREAWSEEEVLAGILAQAGAHFDPQVVQVFSKLVQQGE